jgi:hypothetical protein
MKCRRKFRRRFSNAPTMSITKTINNFVKSFRATFSIPDSKRTRRQHVLKKKTRRNWRLIGDISTERDGSTRTTDGCVWIISTQSNNRTSTLARHKTASFHSPDLNSYERFFFGGKLKDKVCSNNPRTDGLKKNNRDVHVIPSVPPATLRRAMNNMFVRREMCLRAERKYFQCLL